MNSDQRPANSDQGTGATEQDLMNRLAQQGRVEARMPERKLSDAEQTKLRADINEWIRANGIKQARLAAQVEVSKTTLSQVLSGTYKADPSKVLLDLAALTSSLESLNDLIGNPAVAPVRTCCVEDMEGAVNLARKMNTCCLIWGPSGACKSTYAKARAAEKTSCVYVELDRQKYSERQLLIAIADAMRLLGDVTRDKCPSEQLLGRIRGSLAGMHRVVFVDNAHVLDIRGLWLLHTIHDRTGATIVCMGQPLLYRNVLTSRADDGVGATVYARFGVKLDLTRSVRSRQDPTDPTRVYAPARQWLHTVEDVRKFLASRKIKVLPSAVDWLHKRVNCASCGGFHYLEDLVNAARELFDEVSVLTMKELVQIDSLVSPQEEQQMRTSEMQQLRPAAMAG